MRAGAANRSPAADVPRRSPRDSPWPARDHALRSRTARCAAGAPTSCIIEHGPRSRRLKDRYTIDLDLGDGCQDPAIERERGHPVWTTIVPSGSSTCSDPSGRGRSSGSPRCHSRDQSPWPPATGPMMKSRSIHLTLPSDQRASGVACGGAGHPDGSITGRTRSSVRTHAGTERRASPAVGPDSYRPIPRSAEPKGPSDLAAPGNAPWAQDRVYRRPDERARLGTVVIGDSSYLPTAPSGDGRSQTVCWIDVLN